MSDLSSFPITKKWPPINPNIIQLYSLPTPNGIKVAAMLEESGLEYEAHFVDFATDDQHSPEFLSLNPNNKIPAMIDPNGPGGTSLALWESGAMLVYLAEKSGKLLPKDEAQKYQVLQWLMFQMGGAGPMFGQFGYFHKFAGKDIEDKRAYERYQNESKRLLKVIEQQLQQSEYIAGSKYTIADIALWPWFRALKGFYEAVDALDINSLEATLAWYEKCKTRPASLKSTKIPSKPE